MKFSAASSGAPLLTNDPTMNFELNEDQVQLRDSVRRYLDDRYGFESRQKRLGGGEGTDRTMWTEFAAMGWVGLLAPEDAGGLGWGLVDATIVLQEMGRGLVAEPFCEAALLAVRLLVLSQAPAAAEALVRIVDGETLIVPALLEPGKRYDVSGPGAQLIPTGDHLTLSGDKILVSGGDKADAFVVSATLSGETVLALVPADLPGVSRSAYRLMDGGWGCDIRFDAVSLESRLVVAKGAHAERILERSLDEAALGAGAEAIGCMDKIVEMTTRYLRDRKQFGRPLADFQVLQHRISDLFIETEMARSALYGALATLERTPAERQSAVSAARVRIDQAAHLVGNQGIHLHGGMGMTMEYPVGHYYRRLVMLAKTFGDTDYHLERFEALSFGDA